MSYPSYKFDGAKFLESGKSSFRFLHVHSHTDPVNYVHVLQQAVSLRYCQCFSIYLVTVSLLNVLVTVIHLYWSTSALPATLESSYCNQYTSSRNRD